MLKEKITTLTFNISSQLLWGIFIFIVLATSIFSWMLVHHWGYYGIKGNNKIFAKSLYFIGIVTFFVLSVLLLGSYELIK